MLGSTIFFAGGEVETLTRALMDNDVRHVLYSFYYIDQFRQASFIARMQDEHPGVEWFLDSGAFTYSVQVQAGKNLPTPEKYVQRYFNFIDRFGERWCRITEPDLEGIEGLEVSQGDVDLWREQMLATWPHLPIMPVYHGWRGRETWTEYCKDPRIKYLAFGRASGSEPELRALCMEAYRYNKPVHGFGFTKIRTSLRYTVPCSSVDSTTWLMGQKFGTLFIYQGGKMVNIDLTEKRKRALYREHFRRIGCDADKIIRDDVAEVRKANIIAWRDFAARFHQMRLNRERNMAIARRAENRDPVEAIGFRASVVMEREGSQSTFEEREARPRILGAFGIPIERTHSVAEPPEER